MLSQHYLHNISIKICLDITIHHFKRQEQIVNLVTTYFKYEKWKKVGNRPSTTEKPHQNVKTKAKTRGPLASTPKLA